MGGFTVRLNAKGLTRLARTLRQAGADMTDLKRAYRRMADAVKPEVSQAAPRKSGRLARSVRSSATQKGGVVRAGRASIPYAGVINYGWPGHNITGRHYMETGLDRAQDEVEDLFAQAIQQALDQIQGDTTS